MYASWNGATQVASWKVLAQSGTGAGTVAATAAKSGFETAIPVGDAGKAFTVQALDAHGKVIGTSHQFGVSGVGG